MKKLIAACVTAGVLATGSGTVWAAETTPRDARHQESGRHPRARRAVAAALAVSADTIGVERRELIGELRGGKTIADVARAHDVEPQAVIDAIVAAANERIDAALASGRIDEAKATDLQQRVVTLATRLVEETPHRNRSTSA